MLDQVSFDLAHPVSLEHRNGYRCRLRPRAANELMIGTRKARLNQTFSLFCLVQHTCSRRVEHNFSSFGKHV